MILYEVLRLYPPVVQLDRQAHEEVELGGVTYPPRVVLSLLGMKIGTGKSRTDRHRIPYIPTEYRIFGKIRIQEKIREIPVKVGTETVEHFSRPYS